MGKIKIFKNFVLMQAWSSNEQAVELMWSESTCKHLGSIDA